MSQTTWRFLNRVVDVSSPLTAVRNAAVRNAAEFEKRDAATFLGSESKVSLGSLTFRKNIERLLVCPRTFADNLAPFPRFGGEQI